ncbi:hypothetical protein RHABOEDO_000313 [Candidatus Rhabdochlamydia oedothoracis]|uniref:Uncharacterized protein n=1 Tax=Candidatus Rhabdochlamydia oedothoracis TaxID=2720720 RepID=A0ABX8UZ06_9BACT|nr:MULTISPECIES: hypothetical protein [Rhabdochlamydia]KAG6558989.1 hypothetical protein RHOW815_001010 [Candidatus Rhabdochlamydia sp. W815]MCL6756335.1 hypothetical protein [Candidatus Rhabdochlamydia oedothoracis]QYF48198.1 hypothetical protein RHABOEDO_000313 [Candidatus Rhabdochlamydia oedothoracis]
MLLRLLLLLLLITNCQGKINISHACYFSLSKKEAHFIGKKIWQNECGATTHKLLSWNTGEDFLSLGIGHFIWYPKDRQKQFADTFPDFLLFLQKHRVSIPSWLKKEKDCPWYSKQEFDQTKDSRKQSLKKLLTQTIELQMLFIAQRSQKAIANILFSLPLKEKTSFIKKIRLLAQTSNGKYAIIDYINFKGEGTTLKEQYANQGWGLKQVIQNMSNQPTNPVQDFVKAANLLLENRVANAPRDESRWLPGWKNRLLTYLNP